MPVNRRSTNIERRQAKQISALRAQVEHVESKQQWKSATGSNKPREYKTVPVLLYDAGATVGYYTMATAAYHGQEHGWRVDLRHGSRGVDGVHYWLDSPEIPV